MIYSIITAAVMGVVVALLQAGEHKRPGGAPGRAPVPVREILFSAHRSLVRQGAGGYGPWIAACISAIDSGRACPPEVARLAVIRTAEELAGSRFDRSGLRDACQELSIN